MNRNFLHEPEPGAPDLPADLAPYADAIAAHLHQPTAWFVPVNALAKDPAQSKIGGWPYLPVGAPNPLLDEDGEHRYNLLVQLNLGELPEPRPHFFPAQGLLQVFTMGVEELIDEGPGAYRGVYYPAPLAGPAALVTDFLAYDLAALEGYENVPAEGLAVRFQTLTDNRVAPGNDGGGLAYLFAHLPAAEQADRLAQLEDYLAAYNETVADNGTAWPEFVAAQFPLDGDQVVFNSPVDWWGFDIPDHQVGGLLSQFWQGDPRGQLDAATQRPHHDRLLLAYDARGNCTEWAVPFLTNDAKLLFFINRDQLARGNFSDLLFEYMA